MNKYDLEKFKNKENKNNLLKLLNRVPTHWDQRHRRRAIQSPILNRTNRYIREWKVNWSRYSTLADIKPKKKLYIGSRSWVTPRPKPKTKINMGLDL